MIDSTTNRHLLTNENMAQYFDSQMHHSVLGEDKSWDSCDKFYVFVI
jgi:hypothetical protein